MEKKEGMGEKGGEGKGGVGGGIETAATQLIFCICCPVAVW